MRSGMGSQLQRSSPERASKALTTPLGLSTRSLSAIDEPTMTTSPAIAGAEVSVGQVDLTCGAEIGASSPRRRIEGEKPRIDRRQKDPTMAGITLASRGVDPQCDAAIDELFGISRVQVDLRIEAPLLPAGLRVESDGAIERGAQIHRAVGDDGCRLEFALSPIITAV